MSTTGRITDAEWQVMKIIWANDGCTSGLIIDALKPVRNWSATTVKTLLSRLVGKKIISYEKDGRAYRYHSLYTELDCVRNEMKAVIGRIYGGTVNYQTQHFVFYGENKARYIESIAHKLEESYQRILDALEWNMSEKIRVYTHETRQRLHSALGVQNGPKWMRAGWAWEIIHMAPEACFDNIDAAETSVHVFVQIVLHQINPNIPYWLMQGVSAYLTEWQSHDRRAGAIIKKRSDISKGFINEISQDYESFFDGFGYEIAYTIPEYIVEDYSHKHLLRLIKEPNSFENIFACKAVDFWQGWIAFIDAKYVSEVDKNE